MNGKDSAICIIPARGGSKRIPRKNIRPFLGRPIITYAIDAALQAACFDEVMVSTDDEEIARIAVGRGAAVPFMRSAANSDDHSTFMDAVHEVLERYRELGRHFELCCCVYPTAALALPDHLKAGWEHLQADPKLVAAIPVLPFRYPIQRAVRIVDGRMEMFQPEHYFSRSQDLEDAYHDAGQWYWMRAGQVTGQSRLLAPCTAAVVISDMDAQDIDIEDDWRIAELKYSLRQSTS